MTDTTIADRGIEEIFQLRRRAAELRVLERAVAALKAQEVLEQVLVETEEQRDQLATTIEAKRLADEALALVKREIAAQKGEGDTVEFDPETTFGLRRYAAVLMLDNPELDAQEALARARRDEGARFAEFAARVYGDEDLEDA